MNLRTTPAFQNGTFAIISSLLYPHGMLLRCTLDAVLLRDLRRFIAESEKRV